MTTCLNRLRGARALAMVSIVLLADLSVAKQPPRTVEYKFAWGVDRVTFDPSRVRMEDLNRWIELSPILGNYNFMIVPEEIDLLCKPDDPRYQCPEKFDALSEEWNPNLKYAQLNLGAIADRIKRLSPEKYPPELAGVVAYLRKLQSMYLWMHQQELTFLQTNDIAVLERRYGEVDPKKSCDSVIQRIRGTNDLTLRSHIARSDWYNCVLAPAQKELGPYPLDQWKSFLRAYGIQEQRVDEEIDD
jgi:hypothetical protein